MRVLQRKLLISKKCFHNKLKGYTLLEMVIAISISITLITMITLQVNRMGKVFKQDVLDASQHFYISEALRFLEVQLDDNVKRIQVENNCLTLVKYKRMEGGSKLVLYSQLDFSNEDLNRIRLNGSQLQIEYANSNVPVALLQNVEEFEVESIDNRLFVTLKLKGGQYTKKCYDLKYIES